MFERIRSVVPYIVIFIVITLSAKPMLESGGKLLINADFFQYSGRHEAVRKSIVEYHTLPLRSHWLGGGYPTIGDPEDPTFNPLVLLTITFGTVMGMKVIGYVALLIAGLATYAFARCVLGYTRWGALFSGLVYGTCLFIPLRVIDGNINEVYAGFLPLCLLLIGLACRGRKGALVLLPFVFFTMLSDGKLTCLMAMLYIGVLCFLELIPWSRALTTTEDSPTPARVNYRPLKFFALAVGLTALIGMARILPARDLVNSHGGIQKMLASHPKTYSPHGISGYKFEQLWKETAGAEGKTGYTTVGWLPVVLSGIALIAFWRSLLAWGLTLVIFSWLIMAHHASYDLLKLVWHLPVFEAIYRPDKYFSFQIAFTLAIASGRCFSLLRQLKLRWVEALIAIVLIGFSLNYLYPRATHIQRLTYTQTAPDIVPRPGGEIFHIQGQGLSRPRSNPPRSLTYFNLQRNIGTIDWYTGIPISGHAIAKYFVDGNDKYIPNPDYQGEAFLLEPDSTNALPAQAEFRPNSISAQVEVKSPSLLVLNQNFHPDWDTDHGTFSNHTGRLALQLAETGNYTIRLRYHPRAFYAGLVVTVLSLVALVLVAWANITGRLQRWSQHGSVVLKRGSQAILWLIN